MYKLIFLLVSHIYSHTPDEIFTGEWDVHAGSNTDHELPIKYSFEFHLNKTSGRTISTIWHSNIVPTGKHEQHQIEPMIAQFEISFDDYEKGSDDFEGKIYYKDHSIDFELKALENEQFSTKINLDFKNIYVSLEISKNKIIEISIGSLNNEENQMAEANFVAYRAQPVKLVEILPMFKGESMGERSQNRESHQEYTLPKEGATFSDYIKHYQSKAIRYYYLYQTQIYTAVFIIVVQIACFMLVSFIQKTCPKGNKQQKNVKNETDEKESKDEDKNAEEEDKNAEEEDKNNEEEEEKKDEE